MPVPCWKCHRYHPDNVADCETAKKILDEISRVFSARVEEHKKTCRGCPDPEQHIRNLDAMDNPPKEQIRFAQRT